jgi:hypothetical protein
MQAEAMPKGLQDSVRRHGRSWAVILMCVMVYLLEIHRYLRHCCPLIASFDASILFVLLPILLVLLGGVTLVSLQGSLSLRLVVAHVGILSRGV